MNQTTSAVRTELGQALRNLKELKPLVHNITNDVVTNFTANVLLAVGASPAMVIDPDESEEFAAIASSIVINLGTITKNQEEAIRRAVRSANAHATPWVLDPVAAGAIGYRTSVARELILERPSVIRGNSSEIIALARSAKSTGRGVDSAQSSLRDVIEAGKLLFEISGACIAITGETDLVVFGDKVLSSKHGNVLMTRVTGTGCAATALVGAFIGTNVDPFISASAALILQGIAGERAAAKTCGPGSFQAEFLDQLYLITPEVLQHESQIEFV